MNTEIFESSKDEYKFNFLKTDIDSLLWDKDVASTGCVENANFEEYEDEAESIAQMIRAGFSVWTSFKIVFDAMFYDDFMTDEKIEKLFVSFESEYY